MGPHIHGILLGFQDQEAQRLPKRSHLGTVVVVGTGTCYNQFSLVFINFLGPCIFTHPPTHHIHPPSHSSTQQSTHPPPPIYPPTHPPTGTPMHPSLHPSIHISILHSHTPASIISPSTHTYTPTHPTTHPPTCWLPVFPLKTPACFSLFQGNALPSVCQKSTSLQNIQ